MVKVDVSKLQNTLSEVSTELETYKSVFALIKSEYEVIKPIWINGVGDQFFNTVDSNIKDTILLIQSLETFINDMKVLAGNYSSLGSTISCKLDQRSNVLQKYSTAISRVESAANSYNYLGSTYFYPYRGRLKSEESKLDTIVSKLQKYRSKTKSVFNKVKNYENDIRGRLRRVQIIKINNITTFEGNITHTSWAEFKVNEIRSAGKKINLYVNNHKESINKIKRLLSTLGSSYSSDNSSLVNDISCVMISSLTNSNNNNEFCSSFISQYCDKYDATKLANMNNLERLV